MGDDGGHDDDVQEDGGEYLDRLFSREYVWSVVIGGAIWGAMSNVIVFAVTGQFVALKVSLGMVLATPALVAGGMFWPTFEQRFASVLPWMDADALSGASGGADGQRGEDDA